MGDRGRASGASLEVVQGGVTSVPRPKPPKELSNEQAAEWKAIVERMPADWFTRETHSLLAQYCRHIVAARRVAQLIDAHEKNESSFDLEDYDRLLKMQEREGRAISSLATRMRITQQSTYDKSKKKPKAGKRPWDVES